MCEVNGFQTLQTTQLQTRPSRLLPQNEGKKVTEMTIKEYLLRRKKIIWCFRFR